MKSRHFPPDPCRAREAAAGSYTRPRAAAAGQARRAGVCPGDAAVPVLSPVPGRKGLARGLTGRAVQLQPRRRRDEAVQLPGRRGAGAAGRPAGAAAVAYW